MKNSKIEWTDHTFNPWWGCVKVSPACAHCYAAAFSKRTGWDIWGPDKPRRFFGEAHWQEPVKWNQAAAETGERHRVFSGSMCDIFEDYTGPDREKLKASRTSLFALVEATPHLQWLFLTKRPENMILFTEGIWKEWPDNVMAMTTVEDQEQANIRIPELLEVPAQTHGLSCEPLLSELSLSRYLQQGRTGKTRPALRATKVMRARRIDWIIAGGESGPGARPTPEAWFLSLRDQCEKADVAFFFKQWGDWKDGKRLGKREAGRLLRGREWNELPHF
jgi:protein gp37